MEAKDLRLGNLYRYLHEESESIHTVDIDFLKTQLAYDEDPEDEVFCRGWHACPIPLTEEWLLNFGGNKIDMGILFELKKNNTMCLNILMKSCIVNISGCFGLVTPCHIKYVHELQNLFYFLCGEELCLKP